MILLIVLDGELSLAMLIGMAHDDGDHEYRKRQINLHKRLSQHE